jgi:hypothetical protein
MSHLQFHFTAQQGIVETGSSSTSLHEFQGGSGWLARILFGLLTAVKIECEKPGSRNSTAFHLPLLSQSMSVPIRHGYAGSNS